MAGRKHSVFRKQYHAETPEEQHFGEWREYYSEDADQENDGFDGDFYGYDNDSDYGCF